jgi:undecaprenyl-diphosphatase
MDSFSAIILGLVQGLTEFLPVSSTGHLILMENLLGVQGEGGLAFQAVLQLATVCAVIIYFYEDIFTLLQTLMRRLGRLPVDEKNLIMVKALALGTIPAVICGLFLESYMEKSFQHPILVAIVLILGSALFMFAEYRYDNCYHDRELTPKMGWKVGFFQALALFPGMSRSGATIAGGMLLGLSRTEAARFAFLLSVPIILGSGTKKLIELIASEATVVWSSVFFGAVTAFVVGLLAIHLMIGFVRRYSLWPFIWYRIILASFILYVFVFNS